jgi:amidase
VRPVSELWALPAAELARLIRRREVSSREVVAAHLARAEAANPALNAVIESWPERSLREADAADAALARAGGDAEVGPLHGVPFTAKCNLDVAGSPTSEGAPGLADLVATSDTAVVARVRAAGAVLVGRTNMPDLGLRLTTESSLYGPTCNPWDTGRSAAGSSGGEAAAVAAGISPLGLGNDIGGSLRNPAYACGVASVKPGFGRVPVGNASAPIPPLLSSQLMLVNGVLARNVDDLRLGLAVVVGADPSCPDAVDAPLDGPPRPRRVLLVAEPPGGAIDPEVAAGVRAAGAALEAAGWQVVDGDWARLRLEETYEAWGRWLVGELRQVRPLIEGVMGADGRRFLDLTDTRWPTEGFETQLGLHQTRHSLAVAWARAFGDYAAVVGPTWTQPPFPLAWDIESEANAHAVLEMIRFVLPANLLGLPAVCVPTGVGPRGLPLGVQVIGPRLREDVCLAVGADVQAAFPPITPIDPR